MAMIAADFAATSCRKSVPHFPAKSPVVLRGDRALDHEDVFPLVGFHRLHQRELRVVARWRHDRLVIVEGDDVEDQRGQVGLRGPEQRLRTPRAVLHLQPDDGRPSRRSDLGGDRFHIEKLGDRQAERRGDHELAAEPDEIPSTHSTALQMISDGVVSLFFCAHARSLLVSLARALRGLAEGRGAGEGVRS
jgi:hypothetical protein